jgi:hypothetical protein
LLTTLLAALGILVLAVVIASASSARPRRTGLSRAENLAAMGRLTTLAPRSAAPRHRHAAPRAFDG